MDHLPRSVDPGVEEPLVAGVAEHGVDSPTELVASGGNRHARQGGGTIFAATAADGECCAGQERLRESGGNRGAGWCVMHEQAGGAGGSAAGLSPRIVGVGLPCLFGGRRDSGRCLRR